MTQNNPAQESYDKAWALYSENRYSQATKVLVENIVNHPDHAPSRLLLGQIHFFSRKPDYTAALGEFREFVRIDPSCEEGHHWLGSALEQLGEIDEAMAAYREAIRLASEDARPRVALGNCFMRKGRYAEAIKMFRRVLELRPRYTEADVRLFLAEALAKNGQTKDACREWRRVLALEPGYPSYDAPHREAQEMLAKYQES
jgi:tetratricopeptide (TPR) repeat protein